jgi:nucleoside phosphorylase
VSVSVGLVIAMAAEVPGRLVWHSLHGIRTCRLGEASINMLVSGVGQSRARAAALRLCRECSPGYLMSLGTCGGVQDGLEVGDLVLATSVVYRQRCISLAGSRLDDAQMALHGRIPFHMGEMQTADHPVLSRSRVRATAMAVDMESYAITEVAHRHNLQAIVVKVVSDIVPQRANPRSLFSWLCHLRGNFRLAQRQLDRLPGLLFRAV